MPLNALNTITKRVEIEADIQLINIKNMNYPTLDEINAAGRTQICRWYRFLKSAVNDSEEVLLNRICERFKELGGMTSEISKQIGWNGS